MNFQSGVPVGEQSTGGPSDVPVGQSWFIALYGEKGYFAVNDLNSARVNSVPGTRKYDNGIKALSGGCEEGRVNSIAVDDGLNRFARQYEPAEGILYGSWVFPEVEMAS